MRELSMLEVESVSGGEVTVTDTYSIPPFFSRTISGSESDMRAYYGGFGVAGGGEFSVISMFASYGYTGYQVYKLTSGLY
jgi:hypothetical protein